jgi:hypothetical protein
MYKRWFANQVAGAIIIANNVAFHHGEVMQNTIDAAGHQILFLLSYSHF